MTKDLEANGTCLKTSCKHKREIQKNEIRTWYYIRAVAHYGPWILHVAMHGVRAFLN